MANSTYSSNRGEVLLDHNRQLDPATFECWAFSRGTAGMLSQLQGLARAVGLTHQCYSTLLALPWRYMPLGMIPKRASSLTTPEVLNTSAPPRVVISCGRHGVIPALALKNRFGPKVFAVHVQDPTGCTNQFDLVVSPRHDYARGENVYLTTGAVHYVTPELLKSARQDPIAFSIACDDRPVVAVLVGGPNGYYSFGDRDLERFIVKLHMLSTRHHVRLAIMTSSRTPARISARLAQDFSADHFVWNRQPPNPYFTALALAKYVVVTGDSVSMTTEAAATGRPVLVHYLQEKRKSKRFRRFHEMFVEAEITRSFEGELADWSYEIPNDTPKVAQIIRERIAQNEYSTKSVAAYHPAA